MQHKTWAQKLALQEGAPEEPSTFRDAKRFFIESDNLTAQMHEHAGVFIPLPEPLASKYPALQGHDESPPHITLCYIGELSEDKVPHAIEIIREVLQDFGPRECFVGGVAYFTNAKGEEIAHSIVECEGLYKINEEIKAKLTSRGIEVKDDYDAYTPHVTLHYGQARDYRGFQPAGKFMVDRCEFWLGKGKTAAVIPFAGPRPR